MITEDYVSFETAKLLKEKGFDAFCRAHYDTTKGNVLHFEKNTIESSECEVHSSILAPTLQMAMKWLREAHNIIISIFPTIETDMIVREDYSYAIYKNKISVYQNCSITYEQACEAAIKYCLENLI